VAKALQCPSCKHKHRLDSLPGTATFRCERCGQSLKTPAAFRSSSPPPRPPDSTIAAPLRPVRTAGAETAVLPATSEPPPAARRVATAPAAPPTVSRVAHRPVATSPLRIGAWVVAVVVGLIVVGVTADTLGFVTKEKAINMFKSSNPLQYVRLLVLVPFWALATATIAQVLIEGSRWLMARQRAARTVGAARQRPGRTGRRGAPS
jgi:hypothetical protein